MMRFLGRVGVRADDDDGWLFTRGAEDDDVLISILILLRRPLMGTSSSLSLTASFFTVLDAVVVVVVTELPFVSVLTIVTDALRMLLLVAAAGSLFLVDDGSALTVMSIPARASARSLESGTSSSLSLLLSLEDYRRYDIAIGGDVRELPSSHIRTSPYREMERERRHGDGAYLSITRRLLMIAFCM